jgi:acetyl esterase/lipase
MTDTVDTVSWTDLLWRDDGLAERSSDKASSLAGRGHVPLQARVYRPPASAPAVRAGAVVVDVHGGAWASMDRTLGEVYDTAVAAAGFTVVAVDFRDGRQGRHPAAVEDIAESVRWVQAGAGLGLDIDPARTALIGSSSGGHLALHVALTEVEVAFVGAFWPPVDPLARYRYSRSMVGRPVPDGNRLDAPRLLSSTEAYFGDEATMAGASISQLVSAGRARHLPPVWLVHASEDLNVPRPMIDELVDTYHRAGGRVELTEYPGEIHGFGHGTHTGARRFQADLVARLGASLG